MKRLLALSCIATLGCLSSPAKPSAASCFVENENDIVSYIRSGGNINAVDSGVSCLMFSVFHGFDQATNLLMELNADINYREPRHHSSVMFYVVGKNRPDLVRRMLRSGIKVNEIATNVELFGSLSPLHSAIAFHYKEIVRVLLEGGYSANLSDERCAPPLEWAINPEDTEIVDMLIRYGADVNHADAKGITPLMSAVLIGSLPIVRLLVEAGAKVNAVDKEGHSILSFAKDPAIISYLSEQGARR